jgi:hypothetical protein
MMTLGKHCPRKAGNRQTLLLKLVGFDFVFSTFCELNFVLKIRVMGGGSRGSRSHAPFRSITSFMTCRVTVSGSSSRRQNGIDLAQFLRSQPHRVFLENVAIPRSGAVKCSAG